HAPSSWRQSDASKRGAGAGSSSSTGASTGAGACGSGWAFRPNPKRFFSAGAGSGVIALSFRPKPKRLFFSGAGAAGASEAAAGGSGLRGGEAATFAFFPLPSSAAISASSAASSASRSATERFSFAIRAANGRGLFQACSERLGERDLVVDLHAAVLEDFRGPPAGRGEGELRGVERDATADG